MPFEVKSWKQPLFSLPASCLSSLCICITSCNDPLWLLHSDLLTIQLLSSGYIWRWAETKTRWFSLPSSLNFSRGCAVNTTPSPQIVRGASQFECGFSRSCDDSENEPIRLVFLRTRDNHRWQQIMTATAAPGVVVLRASSVVELPFFSVLKSKSN